MAETGSHDHKAGSMTTGQNLVVGHVEQTTQTDGR